MVGAGVSGLEVCLVAGSGRRALNVVRGNEDKGDEELILRHGFESDAEFVLVCL